MNLGAGATTCYEREIIDAYGRSLGHVASPLRTTATT